MPENNDLAKEHNAVYLANYDLAMAIYDPREMTINDLVSEFRNLRSYTPNRIEYWEHIARRDVICNELRNRGIEPGDID